MPFGDVLAGYGQAAFEHQHNVLNMQYGMRKAIAEQLGKMGDDERFDEASRQAFHQEGMNALSGDLTKPYKPPDFSKMMVQPPGKPPVQTQGAPGTPGTIQTPGVGQGAAPESIPQYATAAINPQTVPLPPPAQHPAMQMMTPAGVAERQAPASIIGSGAKAVGEQQEIKARNDVIQSLYPDMDPEVRAMLSLKMPLTPFYGTEAEQDVPGNKIALSHDIFGNPIDKSEGSIYTLRSNKLGQPVAAAPKANPVVGGMQYAIEDATNHWVELTRDRFGRVTIHRDLGVTPPIGVPRENIHTDERAFQQPDGSTQLRNVSGSSVRTIGPGITHAAPQGQTAPATPIATPGQPTPTGQAPAPAPPSGQMPFGMNSPAINAPIPNVPAPQAPTAQGQVPPPIPPNKLAPPLVTSDGRVVGGAHLSREQVAGMGKDVQTYTNTAERMVGLLDGMQNPKINNILTRAKLQVLAEPKGTTWLVAGNLADLSKQEQQTVSDYISLADDINVMRKVYGVGASRGQLAQSILLSQRGNLLGNPEVFTGVLKNSLQSVISQMEPDVSELKRGGRPTEGTPKVIAAYKYLYGPDAKKKFLAAGYNIPGQ